MAAVMNNLVGDGIGYLGNINLKPEQAHTVSATLDLHAADRRWEQLRVTRYYSRVTDYIDAIRCPVGASCALANRTTTNQFVVLQYANQSAELYGLDVSARMPLGGAYVGQGTTMALNPGRGNPAWGTAVPGMGRSIYTGLTLKF
jgi:iron complex outermembrane receptor protein